MATKTKIQQVNIDPAQEELCEVCGHLLPDCTCPKPEEPASEPEEADAILDMIRDAEKRPTDEEIAQFKELHRQVFVTAFDEDNIYVYRPIKSGEFAAIMANDGLTEHKRQELIVNKCLLWPTLQSFIGLDAGVVPSLYQVIMMVSKFASPEQLLAITRPL